MKSSVQFKVVTYANYIISSFIVNTANFADLLERSYEYISLLNVVSDSIFFIASNPLLFNPRCQRVYLRTYNKSFQECLLMQIWILWTKPYADENEIPLIFATLMSSSGFFSIFFKWNAKLASFFCRKLGPIFVRNELTHTKNRKVPDNYKIYAIITNLAGK